MHRDPFLHWLLMMVTFGQYGFLWGFRLAREVSRLSPVAPIAVQMHARIFAIGYILYFSVAITLSFFLWSDGPTPTFDYVFWPTYCLGVALFGHFVWLLTRIAKQLRAVSQTETPRALTVVILSFLWMTSLPLLQSHANKRAQIRRPRQRHTASVLKDDVPDGA